MTFLLLIVNIYEYVKQYDNLLYIFCNSKNVKSLDTYAIVYIQI